MVLGGNKPCTPVLHIHWHCHHLANFLNILLFLSMVSFSFPPRCMDNMILKWWVWYTFMEEELYKIRNIVSNNWWLAQLALWDMRNMWQKIQSEILSTIIGDHYNDWWLSFRPLVGHLELQFPWFSVAVAPSTDLASKYKTAVKLYQKLFPTELTVHGMPAMPISLEILFAILSQRWICTIDQKHIWSVSCVTVLNLFYQSHLRSITYECIKSMDFCVFLQHMRIVLVQNRTIFFA